MTLSRRAFVASALAAAYWPRGRALSGEKPLRGYTVDEIDAKLRTRGKPEDLFKADLPTPALLVDLDLFESNIARMAAHAKAHGKSLRPHAKTHKCVEVARRQHAAGAIGTCVATVAEAIVMAEASIAGVHVTSPIVTPWKAMKIAELARKADRLSVAIESPRQIELYSDAAFAAGVKLDVLVDVNVGDFRTGITPGEPAVPLAQQIARSKHLRLRGVQAYSGASAHVMGFAERRTHSLAAMAKAVATLELFQRSGLPTDILSGASTGTHDIDVELPELTELQVGSYVYMDVDYRKIGDSDSPVFDKFAPALTVLATVVSDQGPAKATVDAGFKAFATDRKFGPEAKPVTGPDSASGLQYAFFGDEFGALTWTDPARAPKLGDRLEFIVPHCDPTVNLYDRVYACRGERVEEVWGIMDRLRT
jgi:D-serine deaminase-like pyridoxal phosphate-dependent protein